MRNRNSYFFPTCGPFDQEKNVLCVYVLCLHGCLYTTCMVCLFRSEEGVGLLGLELLAVVSCHVGTLGFNLGHLKEYLTTDPSLQLLLLISFCPGNFYVTLSILV